MGGNVSKGGDRRFSGKRSMVLSSKEKVTPSQWIHQFKEAYGKDSKSLVELADFLNSALAGCTTARELSAFGLPSKVSHTEFVRLLAQLILVPRLGLIYRESAQDLSAFTEATWLDFLENVQHEEFGGSKWHICVFQTKGMSLFVSLGNSKVPSGPIGFASYIYSPENSLTAAEALTELRDEQQFTQHYVKCMSFPVCWQDASAFMGHLNNSLKNGVKWLYVPISIDNTKGIRCYQTWYV